MKKCKGILFTIIPSFIVLGLTGCGMSKQAKAVQEEIDKHPDTYSAEVEEHIEKVNELLENLSEEDKADVNLDKLNKLNADKENQLSSIANEINTMIDEFEPEVSSAANLKNSYETIKAIMTKIDETDKSADSLIKYENLAGKVATVFDRCNELTDNLFKDGEIIQNLQSIASQLATYNCSTSTVYSYCAEMSSDLPKLANRFSTSKLTSIVDEMKRAALYDDEITVISLTIDVYSEITDLCEKVLDYYEPYTTGISMDTILDDLNSYTNVILERGQQS